MTAQERFEQFLKDLQAIIDKNQISFNGSYDAIWLMDISEMRKEESEDSFVTHLRNEGL